MKKVPSVITFPAEYYNLVMRLSLQLIVKQSEFYYVLNPSASRLFKMSVESGWLFFGCKAVLL